jgi:hypothetical protein
MKRFALLWILIVYLVPQRAQAQYYNGPVVGGTAGAGRATVTPLEGPYLNPASIAHLNKYYLGLAYFVDPTQWTDRENGWGVEVTDATPETLVVASLGYIAKHRELGSYGAVDEQDIQLALAGIVAKGVSFGLAGHHLIQTPAGTNNISSNNLNAGFIITPHPNWGIGLVAYDFLPANNDVPVTIQRQPAYGAGVNYLYDSNTRFKLDVIRQDKNNPNAKLAYMAGVENYLLPELAIRFGFQRDERLNRQIYAAGLGFEGPKFSCDYAAQIRDGESGVRHSIDLWAAF